MTGNGVAPGLRERLRHHSFEWGDHTLTQWVWVGLAAILAVPVILRTPLVPFGTYDWPIVERGVPIMWLCFAGLLAAAARIARASWPFAALIVYAAVRASYHAFPIRSLQLLALLLLTGFLYVLAREMPDRMARAVAIAFVVGAGYEAVLGLFNAFGIYPGMVWVAPEQMGKPMGLLTHPNYWGSWMALSLPLVWALAGVPAAILVGLLILRTVSGGPVITAAVAALVMAWPLFGRRVRLAVIGLGSTAVAVTMTLHEWRLSGRSEVWQAAWPDIERWLFTGQGLGQWRAWADDFNAARQARGLGFFATLQAHSEPYQLLFELGLIGLALGCLWAIQAGRASWLVWSAAPAGRLPSPWYLWGRAPLERAWVAVLAAAAVNMLGSPTFHLPAQGALVLFALARVQADAAALYAVPTLRASARARSEYAARSEAH